MKLRDKGRKVLCQPWKALRPWLWALVYSTRRSESLDGYANPAGETPEHRTPGQQNQEKCSPQPLGYRFQEARATADRIKKTSDVCSVCSQGMVAIQSWIFLLMVSRTPRYDRKHSYKVSPSPHPVFTTGNTGKDGLDKHVQCPPISRRHCCASMELLAKNQKNQECRGSP
jgi:hypothetical protein